MRIRDWSSDVCSSDLARPGGQGRRGGRYAGRLGGGGQPKGQGGGAPVYAAARRDQSAVLCRLCSVISNRTGRPVFLCSTGARWAVYPWGATSSMRSRTRWQARRDRQSVVSGKSVSVRVDLCGRRIIKNQIINIYIKSARHIET